jgi:hypothetical protein
MCHFTCDFCGQTLEPLGEPHFRVTVEGRIVGQAEDSDDECDADSVDAMDELLTEQVAFEAVREDDDLETAPTGTTREFDLCKACYAKLLDDPLGLQTRPGVRFSRN